MAVWTVTMAIGLLVLLPLYAVYRPPQLIIELIGRHSPEVLFRVETTEKLVALTIDDCPSQFTQQLVNVLRANDATATFFAIGGQIRGREELLAKILDASCEIGNHAMHDEPSISLASSALREQIQEVDRYIENAYASAHIERPKNKFFRPGSGVFSRRILEVATSVGYRTILGNVYPHDPFIPYWRINAWHILSMVQPGAIIICHDRRSWTIPMLRKILPELKRKGYRVVTLTELILASKAN